MNDPTPSDPRSLVKTQAETVPAPDVSVPEPTATAPPAAGGQGIDPSVVRRVKELGREVGGLDRLKKLIDELQG